MTERTERADFTAWNSITYQPQWPRRYRPAIGLIGCGGITKHHLQAYAKAETQVVALCDVDRRRAEQRRAQFYPEAEVYEDYRDLLRRDDIEVVDIATHTAIRPPIITAALRAGKHVLSQKPFVTDLRIGRKLIRLAEKQQRRLAVNQNGRWAPHFSYMRQAIASGLAGDVGAVNMSVHWNHGWVGGTPFDEIEHLVLFDYAIHWFDILRCFLPDRRFRRVFAATARSPRQSVQPRLLGQVSLECDGGLAALVFHADTRCGGQDRTVIAASEATLFSCGVNEKQQQLTVHLPGGAWQPALQGCWFPDGFAGTMGELLCAIEQDRESTIDAADNLQSLELCFAAVASSLRGEPLVPGRVTQLP